MSDDERRSDDEVDEAAEAERRRQEAQAKMRAAQAKKKGSKRKGLCLTVEKKKLLKGGEISEEDSGDECTDPAPMTSPKRLSTSADDSTSFLSDRETAPSDNDDVIGQDSISLNSDSGISSKNSTQTSEDFANVANTSITSLKEDADKVRKMSFDLPSLRRSVFVPSDKRVLARWPSQESIKKDEPSLNKLSVMNSAVRNSPGRAWPPPGVSRDSIRRFSLDERKITHHLSVAKESTEIKSPETSKLLDNYTVPEPGSLRSSREDFDTMDSTEVKVHNANVDSITKKILQESKHSWSPSADVVDGATQSAAPRVRRKSKLKTLTKRWEAPDKMVEVENERRISTAKLTLREELPKSKAMSIASKFETGSGFEKTSSPSYTQRSERAKTFNFDHDTTVSSISDASSLVDDLDSPDSPRTPLDCVEMRRFQPAPNLGSTYSKSLGDLSSLSSSSGLKEFIPRKNIKAIAEKFNTKADDDKDKEPVALRRPRTFTEFRPTTPDEDSSTKRLSFADREAIRKSADPKNLREKFEKICAENEAKRKSLEPVKRDGQFRQYRSGLSSVTGATGSVLDRSFDLQKDGEFECRTLPRSFKLDNYRKEFSGNSKEKRELKARDSNLDTRSGDVNTQTLPRSFKQPNKASSLAQKFENPKMGTDKSTTSISERKSPKGPATNARSIAELYNKKQTDADNNRNFVNRERKLDLKIGAKSLAAKFEQLDSNVRQERQISPTLRRKSLGNETFMRRSQLFEISVDEKTSNTNNATNDSKLPLKDSMRFRDSLIRSDPDLTRSGKESPLSDHVPVNHSKQWSIDSSYSSSSCDSKPNFDNDYSLDTKSIDSGAQIDYMKTDCDNTTKDHEQLKFTPPPPGSSSTSTYTIPTTKLELTAQREAEIFEREVKTPIVQSPAVQVEIELYKAVERKRRQSELDFEAMMNFELVNDKVNEKDKDVDDEESEIFDDDKVSEPDDDDDDNKDLELKNEVMTMSEIDFVMNAQSENVTEPNVAEQPVDVPNFKSNAVDFKPDYFKPKEVRVFKPEIVDYKPEIVDYKPEIVDYSGGEKVAESKLEILDFKPKSAYKPVVFSASKPKANIDSNPEVFVTPPPEVFLTSPPDEEFDSEQETDSDSEGDYDAVQGLKSKPEIESPPEAGSTADMEEDLAELAKLDKAALLRKVQELHKTMKYKEEEKYEYEVKIRKQDLEINELTSTVNDVRGKYNKPVLKKVTKTEKLAAKVEKKAGIGDIRSSLKSTGQSKYQLDDQPQEPKTPDWKAELKPKVKEDEAELNGEVGDEVEAEA